MPGRGVVTVLARQCGHKESAEHLFRSQDPIGRLVPVEFDLLSDVLLHGLWIDFLAVAQRLEDHRVIAA